MQRLSGALAMTLALLIAAGGAWAEGPASEQRTGHRLAPWDGLASHAARSFWGWNLAFHLTAVGQTALVSRRGWDHEVRQTFHRHPNWGKAAYPAVILGALGPVGVIGGLYAKGYWGDDDETLAAAHAVLQANALTLGYVTLLKFTTGRPPPHDELVGPLAGDMRELSQTFRWGLGRGGVFHGWPSGHVAATMATCASLAAYYPDSLALELAGAAGVAYMMFSVTSFQAGSMHWFSDAVAGALMAYPIGVAVGSGFRRRQSAIAPAPSRWLVAPVVTPQATLIAAGRAF
jgi:membrane-associated phospholipid phosphatase